MNIGLYYVLDQRPLRNCIVNGAVGGQGGTWATMEQWLWMRELSPLCLGVKPHINSALSYISLLHPEVLFFSRLDHMGCLSIVGTDHPD